MFDPVTWKPIKTKLQKFWHYNDNFKSLETHNVETFSWNPKETIEKLLEVEQPTNYGQQNQGDHDNLFVAGVTKVTDWFSDLFADLKNSLKTIALLVILGAIVFQCIWCKCYRCVCKVCPSNCCRGRYHSRRGETERSNADERE